MEVECSGQSLSSDVDVFLMTLFSLPLDHVIASVNLRNGKCITSRTFSSCAIDDKHSLSSKLKSLVVDMEEGEKRRVGCNVSGSQAEGRAVFFSWTIEVTTTPGESLH